MLKDSRSPCASSGAGGVIRGSTMNGRCISKRRTRSMPTNKQTRSLGNRHDGTDSKSRRVRVARHLATPLEPHLAHAGETRALIDTALAILAPVLVLAVILALLTMTPAKAQSTLSGSKPNIVVILADDLSYRDLSIWGQARFSTPNLDRLAMEGLRLTQAYAGAPECAPSRGTLMTGLHTGHATGFFGKWGIGLPGTPGTPDKQGFDEAFGFYDQRRAHTFFPRFLYRNEQKIEYPGNFGFDMVHMYEDNRTPAKSRDSAAHYDSEGRLLPPGASEPSKAVYSEDVIEDAASAFVRRNR